MKKEDLKRIIRFLNEQKTFVGLDDWKILLNSKKQRYTDGSLAECEVDIYEKHIKIYLSDTFFTFDKTRQENILFHELMHAKYQGLKIFMTDIVGHLEEQFINDLVRGFEKRDRRTEKTTSKKRVRKTVSNTRRRNRTSKSERKNK